MEQALSSIAPLLPLEWNSDRSALVWPLNASLALAALVRGPTASGVSSGESLIDYIVEMRSRVGMDDSGVPSKAIHGLTTFFEIVPQEFSALFFCSILPSIAKLALKLSSRLRDHVERSRKLSSNFAMSSANKDLHLRVLASQQTGFVFISQELAASVLACAFLCLYPSTERRKLDLPSINFEQMFIGIFEKDENLAHKLMCILNYFRRVCENMPQGMISYERKVLHLEAKQGSSYCPDAEYWASSSVSLCPLVVLDEGTIESNESTALEVDFANRYLGGGALHSGCLQEEIRFMINPELIAGRLFLPAMADNEAIEIVGAERFSQYEGYGTSFRFTGDYVDKKPRDCWGRRLTYIVAIDALARPGEEQFNPHLMLREVNKAFCGFLDHHGKSPKAIGIATGNWGCGVFAGDHEVKSALQWLAASEAGRPFLLYYAFQDPRAKKIQKVATWIHNEGWSVLDLWTVLLDYGSKRKDLELGFFDWLLPDTETL